MKSALRFTGWRMNPDRKTRILLADDHSVVRSGFRALLSAQPDLEVVGERRTAAMRSSRLYC